MATATQLYGGVTAITLTGASLGSYAAREGTLVVNTTNLYLDAILSGHIVQGAAVSTGNIYILLSSSDATDISSPATGADAAITIPGIAMAGLETMLMGQIVPQTELVFLAKVACSGAAAGATTKYANLSVSQAFNLGGLGLPPQWAPVIVNCTGQALSATASVTNYNGVKQTIA